ncbi:hypothetical protein [Amycolatopsis sp. RTGN1]|uniref:hypothetical protein n=1 Tax=Amycolatopsis ponsaeliensis TaxID=2992142 RepID=UPI0025516E60|nr:hypothetical protein [Amycolatopsis sp. RTGN1]
MTIAATITGGFTALDRKPGRRAGRRGWSSPRPSWRWRSRAHFVYIGPDVLKVATLPAFGVAALS